MEEEDLENNIQTFCYHLGNGPKKWKDRRCKQPAWLLSPNSRVVLELAVQRASIIAHRASVLFNAYLHQVESISLEGVEYYRQIVTHCFLISKTKYKKNGSLNPKSVAAKNPRLLQIYLDIYGENNFVDGTGLNSMLETMAKKYTETIFVNFAGPTSAAYTNHMINAVRSLFALPAKWMARKMYDQAYPYESYQGMEDKTKQAIIDRAFGKDSQRYDAAIQLLIRLELDSPSTIGERTTKRREMLRYLKANVPKSKNKKGVEGQFWRGFTLAPIMRVKRQFVPIHGRVIEQLRALAKKLDVPWIREDDIETTPSLLDRLFHREARKEKVLADSVLTDNVTLCVIYSKNKPINKSGKAKWKAKRKRQENKLLERQDYEKPPQGTPIRCVDPGNKNFLSYGEYAPRSDGKEMNFHNLSKAEWKQRCGDKWFMRKLKSRLQNSHVGQYAKAAEKWFTKRAFGCKASTYAEFVFDSRIRLCMEQALWNCYGARTVATWRFTASSWRRRALDEVVDELTHKGTFTIGLGDCAKHTGIRGCDSSGPVKELYRHLKKKTYHDGHKTNVFKIKEGMTTKMASCCRVENKTMKVRKYLNKERTKSKVFDSRDVKICTKCNCHWARDLNPVINMFRIVESEERPFYLQQQQRAARSS